MRSRSASANAAKLSQAGLWLLTSAAALLVSFPLLWMVISSFKTSEELWRVTPTLLPVSPSLEGYRHIFTQLPFGRYFLNSAIVAGITTSIAVSTSALAGYIFAKFEFKCKRLIFFAILSSLMIPGPVMIIPRYILVNWFGWIDTYWALIIPQGITVFGVFLMRQYIHAIPSDYIDAARVDGMGEFGIFARIILPLSRPAIAALAILSFIGSWDALLWPLVVISSDEMRTLPMGIAGLATVHSPILPLMLPAATISVVPVVVIFALFQKQFVNAMTSTGLK